MFKSILTIFFFVGSLAIYAQSISYTDSVIIQAKVWSKNKEKVVNYSNWKPFVAHTVGMIKDFDTLLLDDKIDKYGGSPSLKSNASDYFRVEKINDRFWFIDPLGNSFLNIAINGIRPGNSSTSAKFLNEKFGGLNSWIKSTSDSIKSFGFNSAGSWSDVISIQGLNKSINTPLAYCTQLSVLGTFMQKVKKKKEKKEYPILALAFDKEFENHCVDKILENKDKFNDPNLLGHFSDNELPFQENLLKLFLDINDESDNAYQLALKYVVDHNIDINNFKKEEQESFAGIVASKYFETLSRIIKKYDANHLYLGSRLHSSAKNNTSVLNAAEKYLDVISINFYGHWDLRPKENELWGKLNKPFIITEFYTKGDDTQMENKSGAGWIVSTQKERGIHYQNFLLSFLSNKNFIGLHWFRYQDNDPNDNSSDASNMDSNKGMVNTHYEWYTPLTNAMSEINNRKYRLVHYIDNKH
jgi:hypothetical protein